jgi:hypothetical protein
MRASPAVVAHADWSKDPSRRWLAVARMDAHGGWTASGPERAVSGSLIARLHSDGVSGPALVGVDFPIGLPRAYARRAGILSFVDWLSGTGSELMQRFLEPATSAEEIGLDRPFFPQGLARRGDRARLCQGLELGWDELYRRCERGRPPASPLFWTAGAGQVGKAAIAGWRELVAPALEEGRPRVGVWPFHDPSIGQLLAHHDVVLAETYPARLYARAGIDFRSGRGGKTDQAARAAQAGTLIDSARRLGVRLSAELRAAIADGFPACRGADDGFDATVGLMGMIDVLASGGAGEVPDDDAVVTVEGWMLGLPPTA